MRWLPSAVVLSVGPVRRGVESADACHLRQSQVSPHRGVNTKCNRPAHNSEAAKFHVVS